MMQRSVILLVEPLCTGAEHAPVNAAMIATVREAFPLDRVEFWASNSHIAEVQRILSVRSLPSRAIQADTWKEITPVNRTKSFVRRFVASTSIYRAALRHAASMDARCCVFTSFDDVLLRVSKAASNSLRYHGPVLAVFHSALARLALPAPRFSWRRSLRALIEQPRASNFRIVVLGSSILNEAIALAPNARSLAAIEHPYLWHTDVIPPLPRPPVRFGSFGGTWKGGADELMSLQRQVRASAPQAKFSIIGRVESPERAGALRKAGCEVATDRLTLEEYATQAMSIDYAIWLAAPEPYRLTASGSFLDCLSYVKPCLVLRNRYVEECFRKLGDIGYLCESLDEMVVTARTIASDPPVDRFVTQCRNIIAGRQIFAPASVAVELRAIVDEMNRSGVD
jgi:hypothetical protein